VIRRLRSELQDARAIQERLLASRTYRVARILRPIGRPRQLALAVRQRVRRSRRR
jgi:hypothetical protein